MPDISFSDIYFKNGVYYTDSQTTIDTYLKNNSATCADPNIDYCNNKTVYGINTCLDTAIKNKEKSTILGTAKTTKNDFVALYNEQYTSTVELFIGIVVISLVLSKMVFYPMKI
jgi:hypothetical protein